jgi:hypothetical protein
LRGGFSGATGLLGGLGLFALLAGAIIARRNGSEELVVASALTAVLVVASVPTLALLTAPLYPYLWGWVSLLGMLCWVVPVTLVLRTRTPRFTEQVLALGAGVLCLSIGIRSIAGDPPRSPLESPRDAGVVVDLLHQAARNLNPSTPYRVCIGDDRYNSVFLHGVVDGLRERGYHLEVPPDLAVIYGSGMARRGALADRRLRVIAPYTGPRDAPGIVAVNDPLPAAERSEEIALTASVISAFQAAGRLDAAGIVEHATDLASLAGQLAPGVVTPGILTRLDALRRPGPVVAIEIDPAQP